MPVVSVVIPTYNRADTIMRSLKSVLSQTFQDYELIVVDDGSTDNTYDIIKDLDQRLKIITQPNQGVSAARNNGIRESKGKYIALLDSDDAWDPLYLEACISFLENHPDESVVHTEFLWKLRKDYSEIQPSADIIRIFIPLAKKVGSNLLDLPPGETDNYLRIYREKLPVGKWAEGFLQKMNKPFTHYYRGYVFDQWRWGYLMSAWSTVFTKEAFEKIGGFANQYKTAEDYDFLTRLCKNYRVNFLPFPGAIKNEFQDSGQKIKEEHLASGKNALNFAINYLERFEAIFLNDKPDDRELLRIKAWNETCISEVALKTGDKEIAQKYAKAALQIEPGLFRAKLILILLNLLQSVKLANWLYNLLRKSRYWIRKIFKLST